MLHGLSHLFVFAATREAVFHGLSHLFVFGATREAVFHGLSHIFVFAATREAAFIHAVTSAGVVHAVTQSCSAGNLTDCSCDMKLNGQVSEEGWKWGGCSDNVDYGVWFAQTFVDAVESDGADVRSLVNLQNNQVGRQVILIPLYL